MATSQYAGWIPGYDCNDEANEPRPATVVYSRVFEELQRLSRQAASQLRTPLENSKYKNGITAGLLKELVRRTKEGVPDVTTFAIAGDMSSGKSSLINSILSVGIITRKGDSGGSCTWVVQRFMKMFVGQASPYAAKVYFFGSDEIRDIIASLLARYYHAAGCEEDDDMKAAQSVDAQVADYGGIRDALRAFTSLFGDKGEFEDKEHAKGYLDGKKPADDEDTINLLLGWAEDVVAAHLAGAETVNVEESTVDRLMQKLQPYTYAVEGIDGVGQRQLWPLVSVIDFGLDHQLLNENIVLVDSPGLSDANQSRAKNAAHHHRQCTHKIVVSEIGRIEDLPSVRQALCAGFRRGESGNTILALTHADALDEDTDIALGQGDNDRDRQLKLEIQALRSQKASLAETRKSMPKADFRDQMDEINEEMERRSAERNTMRLSVRNRKCIKEMSEMYRDLTRDPLPLPVFAVGDEAYKVYQAGYFGEDKPSISVEQTGIPALRKCIYLLPSESRLNEALHLATVQLPSLLNSFELYCSKTHMARKAEIEAIVLEPKKLFRGLVSNTFEMLRSDVSRLILVPMKVDEPNWVLQARKRCRTWALHYTTPQHLAFLKNDGRKKGIGRGAPIISWNKQLAEIGREDLEASFTQYQKNILPKFNKNGLAKDIQQMLDKTQSKIRNDRQFNLMALDVFLKRFDMEKKTIQKALESTVRGHQSDMSDILEDAIADSETSFIAVAMRKIYAEVRKLKGAGAPKKRIELLEKMLTQMNGVWMAIYDGIVEETSRHLRKREEQLADKLEEIFSSLHRNFVMLCDDKVVKDDAEKQLEENLRANLATNLDRARELVEGPIQAAVEGCKSYGSGKGNSAVKSEVPGEVRQGDDDSLFLK